MCKGVDDILLNWAVLTDTNSNGLQIQMNHGRPYTTKIAIQASSRAAVKTSESWDRSIVILRHAQFGRYTEKKKSLALSCDPKGP